MGLTIALDGPVGAGKSTVADAVAQKLGILHLDTGAMYRAVGLSALRQGIDLANAAAVTAHCGRLMLTVRYQEGQQRTLVDGVDVTDFLRTDEVGMAASTVSRYPGVRAGIVALQQRLASQTDMLLDGRDIGTRVLPHAKVKIFLTAAPEARARRRYEELRARGVNESYEQVLKDLMARDEQDTHRAVDPLRPAEDAITVDTTHLSFEETVETVLSVVRRAEA